MGGGLRKKQWPYERLRKGGGRGGRKIAFLEKTWVRYVHIIKRQGRAKGENWEEITSSQKLQANLTRETSSREGETKTTSGTGGKENGRMKNSQLARGTGQKKRRVHQVKKKKEEEST